MNKVFLTIAIAAISTGVFAQNNTSPTTTKAPAVKDTAVPLIVSKKGEMYLPQPGNWAIGFDATPFLTYFGGLLSQNGATAPTAKFLNSNQTITGKYYVDAHTAYRGILRLGYNSVTQNADVPSTSDINDTDFPTPLVEDQRTVSNYFIGIGAGIEKRKGKTRLQGYYGAELMVFFSGSDTSYKYGNAFNTTSNPTPGFFNWTAGDYENLTSSNPRVTELSSGTTIGVELLGFVGVEYFFAPKISVGAEYTWGIEFQTTGKATYSLELINPKTNADQTYTYKVGGSTGFSLDTGLNQVFGSGGGSLNLTFHF